MAEWVHDGKREGQDITEATGIRGGGGWKLRVGGGEGKCSLDFVKQRYIEAKVGGEAEYEGDHCIAILEGTK